MELVQLDIKKEFPPNACQPDRLFQLELFHIDNARLSQYILDLEKKEKTLNRTNRGGWHSGKQLFHSDEKFLCDLRDAITKCAERLLGNTVTLLSAWANVNRYGHYNISHRHGGCNWACCYYVATDITAAGGEFVATPEKKAIKIVPMPGRFLLFPSSMTHQVLEYKGVAPRISIACNMGFVLSG